MGKGWISLSRGIQDCYLWQEKPYSRGQAWVDLILLANHKDGKAIIGNELIDVKRGSFITSEVKLMNKWGWGKGKLRAFLKILENDGMIVKKSDRKKTTITIVKYDVYQNSQTTDGLQSDYNRTDNGLITDTNNNDNNVNNDNNIYYQQIADMYNNTCVSFPRCNTLSDKRKKAIKARLKKYSIEDLQRAFEKAESSDFLKGSNNRNWSANFDWMLKDSNIAKILDGNYDNKAGQRQQPKQSTTNKFNAFPQREYTPEQTAELERKFMNTDYFGEER